jgi:hypothetical protein
MDDALTHFGSCYARFGLVVGSRFTGSTKHMLDGQKGSQGKEEEEEEEEEAGLQ